MQRAKVFSRQPVIIILGRTIVDRGNCEACREISPREERIE